MWSKVGVMLSVKWVYAFSGCDAFSIPSVTPAAPPGSMFSSSFNKI